MIALNDIKQLITQYGNDILDDPKRVRAILCDWHPRQRVPFDEVQDTCRKWKKGEISLSPEGNPATSPSAFANILEKAKNLIIPRSKASDNPVYRIIETPKDTDSTTPGNTTGATKKADSAKKQPTKPKPIKPTINTTPIDIKIDTSKSFRGRFR